MQSMWMNLLLNASFVGEWLAVLELWPWQQCCLGVFLWVLKLSHRLVEWSSRKDFSNHLPWLPTYPQATPSSLAWFKPLNCVWARKLLIFIICAVKMCLWKIVILTIPDLLEKSVTKLLRHFTFVKNNWTRNKQNKNKVKKKFVGNNRTD